MLSGKRGTARPEWQALLEQAHAGDIVKFWAARSPAASSARTRRSGGGKCSAV